MDLLEQLAGVWRRRFYVLGIALFAASAVLFWRSSLPDEYAATTTMQVRVANADVSDPSTQVDYYARTVIALATNRGVVTTALAAANRTDEVSTAVDKISAEAGSEPGFVTVTASGTTPETAAGLADEVAATLSEVIAQNQADALETEREALRLALAEVGQERIDLPASETVQRAALMRESEALLSALRTASSKSAWQLVTVETAEEPSAPVAPQPVRDALLAFLLAAIVMAEIVIVRRSWRGELSLRDPARDAGEISGLPSVAIGPTDGPASLAALLPQVGAASTVLVIQQGARPSAHAASLLAELLAGYDDSVLLVDAGSRNPAVHLEFGTPASPGLSDIPPAAHLSADPDELREQLLTRSPIDHLEILAAGASEGPVDAERLNRIATSGAFGRVVIAASVSRIDQLIPVLIRLQGPVVLDVEPGTMTRKQLRKQMSALTGLGVEVVAITVQSSAAAVAVRREQRQLRHAYRGPRIAADDRA